MVNSLGYAQIFQRVSYHNKKSENTSRVNHASMTVFPGQRSAVFRDTVYAPPAAPYTSPHVRRIQRHHEACLMDIFYCAHHGHLTALQNILEPSTTTTEESTDNADKAETPEVSVNARGYIPPFHEGIAYDIVNGSSTLAARQGFHLVHPNAPQMGRLIYACTPLAYAAAQGHVDVVKYLIEKGADVSPKSNDTSSASPLRLLCWGYHPTALDATTEVSIDEIVRSRIFLELNDDKRNNLLQVLRLLDEKYTTNVQDTLSAATFTDELCDIWLRNDLILKKITDTNGNKLIAALDANNRSRLYTAIGALTIPIVTEVYPKILSKKKNIFLFEQALTRLRHLGVALGIDAQWIPMKVNDKGGEGTGGEDADPPEQS